MIGNDVVDIATARTQSNIWRKGWQEKLFTNSERLYISQSANPEISVWLLWSMKEAAYKAWNRNTGVRAFNPQKLLCNVEDLSAKSAAGKVVIAEQAYSTISTINEGAIYTIAAEDASLFRRIRAISPEDICKDERGLPYIIRDEKHCQASKSHHGKITKSIFLT